MAPNFIKYQRIEPDESLSEFVQCFWSVGNNCDQEKKFTILPDGYFDIIFRFFKQTHFTTFLSGLWTREVDCIIKGNETVFAVSFKLPAVDCLLGYGISPYLNKEVMLPAGFGNIQPDALSDFNVFVKNISLMIKEFTSASEMDPRKRELFRILYVTGGIITVEELAKKVYWSRRQINRYFNSRFGISLKAYCNILRYRLSFGQMKDKEGFPEENYTDKAHFIKEVKKYSGVTPGKIVQNKNDRFIQLSTLEKNNLASIKFKDDAKAKHGNQGDKLV